MGSPKKTVLSDGPLDLGTELGESIRKHVQAVFAEAQEGARAIEEAARERANRIREASESDAREEAELAREQALSEASVRIASLMKEAEERAEALVGEAEAHAAQVRKRALEEVGRAEREVQGTETALARSRSRLTVLRREAE